MLIEHFDFPFFGLILTAAQTFENAAFVKHSLKVSAKREEDYQNLYMAMKNNQDAFHVFFTAPSNVLWTGKVLKGGAYSYN